MIAEYDRAQVPGYLDPSNRGIPMTVERHAAILRTTVRTEHYQRIGELEQRAAEAGDYRSRRYWLDQAQPLRAMRLP